MCRVAWLNFLPTPSDKATSIIETGRRDGSALVGEIVVFWCIVIFSTLDQNGNVFRNLALE
jgi:hypothetical protein